MSLNIDKLHSPSTGRRSGKTTKLLAYALGELMLQESDMQVVLVVAFNANHQKMLARQLIDISRDMDIKFLRSEVGNGVKMFFEGAKGYILLKWIREGRGVEEEMRGYDYVTYDDREFGY